MRNKEYEPHTIDDLFSGNWIRKMSYKDTCRLMDSKGHKTV